MTKSSEITNQLSITMAGLIIYYLFSSDLSALVTTPLDNIKDQLKLYLFTLLWVKIFS